MADELLFADRTADDGNDSSESEKSLFEKMKQFIRKYLSEEEVSEEANEDDGYGLGLTAKEEDEGDDDWITNLDRLTIVLITGEILLLTYFILALLNFVPFF